MRKSIHHLRKTYKRENPRCECCDWSCPHCDGRCTAKAGVKNGERYLCFSCAEHGLDRDEREGKTLPNSNVKSVTAEELQVGQWIVIPTAPRQTFWQVMRKRPDMITFRNLDGFDQSFGIDTYNQEYLGTAITQVPYSVFNWDDRIIPKILGEIIANKEWQNMPILADALEDAGYNNQTVLHELRKGNKIALRFVQLA